MTASDQIDMMNRMHRDDAAGHAHVLQQAGAAEKLTPPEPPNPERTWRAAPVRERSLRDERESLESFLLIDVALNWTDELLQTSIDKKNRIRRSICQF
jgi:hypothetical protein